MATLTGNTLVRSVIRHRVILWLAAVGTLVTLLTLLSLAIKNEPTPSQDQTILDWVIGRDAPLIAGFFEGINFLTSNLPAMGLGLAGIAFLWLLGMTREAFGFALVGGIVGIVAFGGDYTLGEFVGRSRPLEMGSESFPSGHTFGSTVFFGFWGFLAVYFGLKKKLLVPLLILLAALILAVGFARIFEQAHWPSDVAAGYLLGVLWLLLLIPFFLYIQRVSWLSIPKRDEDLTVRACETCRVEKSIASTVVLDPERGTATKVYSPPGVVRLLYWLAFQARFPYENNRAALQAARHRRRIAGLLTSHRFGKDLVAPVTTVECMHGQCSFVTEFVPGEKVMNDEPAKLFLGQVAETFAEAGLSVWQVNPRNPHAHTNLIRTPDGDLKIIDLESAVVTPIPAPGQWRSALKRGTFPVFDDIDFERLRHYVTANGSALAVSLGPAGMAELSDAVDLGEEAIRSWKDAEPRVWGRLISRVYRLLDWKGSFLHLKHALAGAGGAAEVFLNRGIDRWEAEGRLEPSQTAELRTHLASGEAHQAFRHLGAHLILSVAIMVPVPGLRSAARFAWTLAFWLRVQGSRLLRGASAPAGRASNIHSPLVMLLALVPSFGAVAYLAARPLRQKPLIRLMLDQTGQKLPFHLYARMRLGRLLAPPMIRSEVP